jgi:DNA-binding FrmR family transcriptional regulator
LAAAAEELSTRLDRLSEDGDIEELRAALARIEKTVEALAEARHAEEDVGDILAQLGASLSVLAEVSVPSRFHQLNQIVTDSDQERRRELESLRAALGRFEDA